MLHKTNYGPVWVSEQAPYYRDYLGKQLNKQRYAGKRRKPVAEQAG
jgi:hypothetical protein